MTGAADAARTVARRAASTAAEGAARFAGEVVSPAVEETGKSLVPVAKAVPGLARVTGTAALNVGAWGARAYVRAGLRMARATVDSEEFATLAHDAAEVVGVVTELVRGVLPHPPEADLVRLTPDPGTHATSRPRHEWAHARSDQQRVEPDDSPDALRRRGAELLDRSRDVWAAQLGHPAYSRILDELAPDEARILLYLMQSGPQPSVDVRTGGLRSGTLIAPGLSMIGARSGVRFIERVPAYLNNLARLGLVWFSKEAVRDPMEYQVLEAQPDVLAALHSVTFAKVVRRSIQLTPFGIGFCKTCLVADPAASFPEHDAPSAAGSTEPPKE